MHSENIIHVIGILLRRNNEILKVEIFIYLTYLKYSRSPLIFPS